MPRPSPVRDQVRSLLLSGARHAWSLEELLDRVRASTPSANYSSVFRAVTFLEQEGVVQRVEVGDGRGRYEPNSNHHDHVACDGCGRVVEIQGDCLVRQVDGQIAAMTGFAVSGHSLVFTGTCPDCQHVG
jgi:Fur family transcriptional regulator, ferric uptake regulator